MVRDRFLRVGRFLFACIALGWFSVSFPQDSNEEESAEEESEVSEGSIEEITVTARRVEEGLQDVPIAISALTEDIIEERQIVTVSDLQLNDTSTTFTGTNFGGASLTIRGVGRLVIGSAGNPGVSTHINEVDLPYQFGQHEFFDIGRVEILRGPQGTLYGRNATGGSINVVTNMPDPTASYSNVDMELGNFAHRRFTATMNAALGGNAAVRVSGFRLNRNGYTENLAYGQVGRVTNQTLPNIDEDIDGRNISAMRFTFTWDSSDRMSYWFQYHYLDEDDDRSRRTSQVCVRDDLPVLGCEANEKGFEGPNLGGTTEGVFTMALGLYPLGASGADPSLYDHPRPEIDSYRQVHIDHEPVFQLTEQIVMSGLSYQFDMFEVAFHAASLDRIYLSQEDYIAVVGPLLGGPTGPSLPVSAPNGAAGDQWTTGLCNIFDGTAGIHGGCVQGSYRHAYSYDQSSGDFRYTTLEVKLRSLLDGPMNLTAGFSMNESRNITDYYVLSNTLDVVSVSGVPDFGLPALYPGFFLNSNSPWSGSAEENMGVFGQLYYDFSDALRFTLGLRYNDDLRSREDSSVLYNAYNQSHIFVGNVLPALRALLGIPPSTPDGVVIATGQALGLLSPFMFDVLPTLGIDPLWSRATGILLGPLLPNPEVNLATYYGADPADIDIALRTPAYSPERVALAGLIPIVPDFGESRGLTNSPSSAEFTFLSSRVGFDYHLNNDSMFYGFFSRGYKPGGLNPAIPVDFQDISEFTYDQETVNAFEIGTKNTLLDGLLRLNGAAFIYDYQGLQSTRIKNNASLTENMNVEVSGVELDGVWSILSDGSLFVDFAYTLLNTSIVDTLSLDPLNRTAGNPAYLALKNIDPGASTGVAFVVREADITPAILQIALANAATGAILPVFYPPNGIGLSIPVYWSRTFLDSLGVETLEGILTDLSGNQVPHAPPHSMRAGFAYTLPSGVWWGGVMTVRWDFYWQAEQFSREFNTPGDLIEAWSQHNFSLNFVSANGRWEGRFWVRNVMDAENVTGEYLTSDTSGFFRNAFTTEPRIFGLSARARFGG